MARIASLTCRVSWSIFPVVTAGLIHAVVLKTDQLHTLAIPLDGGRRWRGHRLFGSNKTWRGLLLMTVSTAGLTRLQMLVGRWEPPGSRTGRFAVNPWLAGGLMGMTYCLAELPNSFCKRQLGISPGTRSRRAGTLQYVVDQTDSVLGCLIVSRFLYRSPPAEMTALFILGTAIHIGVDRGLYALGVKHLDA